MRLDQDRLDPDRSRQGTIFKTTRQTLTHVPGSLLGRMFNPDSSLPLALGEVTVETALIAANYFRLLGLVEALEEDAGDCHGCVELQENMIQLKKKMETIFMMQERITLGKSSCDEKVCQAPVTLFNSPMSSTRDEEDSCCPFKIISRELFDLRCIFCRVLPRVGFCASKFKRGPAGTSSSSPQPAHSGSSQQQQQ